MANQCDFHWTGHRQCPITDTRWIKEAARYLCKEHHFRCGRSTEEWAQATSEKTIADPREEPDA